MVNFFDVINFSIRATNISDYSFNLVLYTFPYSKILVLKDNYRSFNTKNILKVVMLSVV